MLLAILGVWHLAAFAAEAGESDTVRVTRQLDAARAERAATLERREQARARNSARQDARREARIRADIARRDRTRASPQNRLTGRLYPRLERLGRSGSRIR